MIAGSARGIRLVGPGPGTRPLGDRVKQSLFAILGTAFRDRPVLDLFAGSGAAGIEALSRGASNAVFVDRDRSAVAAIEQNLETTHFTGARAMVRRAEVGAWLAKLVSAGPPESRFALVFVDPPYDEPSYLDETLEKVAAIGPNQVLDQAGVLVAKHFWKVELPAEIGLLRSVRHERFGETMLTFYRWSAEEGT